MVLRVDNLSHLQWANRVIEWEGKDANLEEIYNMSVQELADRFKARADADSDEDDDESCDDFEIDGLSKNRLLQTVDGKKLCELNNGMHDLFIFELDTFVNKVDPALFALPKGGCSRHCGAVGGCQATVGGRGEIQI